MAGYSGATVELLVDNGSAVYTEVAQVVDINTMPGIEVDDIEVSTRDSADWGEFIAGFKMAGEGQFDIVYDPDNATHVNLLTLATGRTIRSWKLNLPGTTNAIVVNGFVKSFKPKAPLKDKLSADIVIKFTGAVTFPS